MGRKSLAEERREEILAAFERCIGRYGIDVPLEQIADEAGVKRSLIRHYLGNRDELVDQVINQIAESYPQRVSEWLARGLVDGIDGVLDVFFANGVTVTQWDDVIGAVMSTAQGRYPLAKQRLAQMMMEIVDSVAQTLAQLFPGATAAACSEVAYGVVCLTQTNESLLWLGIDPGYTAVARANAERLLSGLGEIASTQCTSL